MTKKDQTINNKARTLTGVVVSNKMEKTVVVAVDRFVKHPKYGKFVRRTKRYKAHAPTGEYKLGDKVTIKETRPISRDKHFMVI